MKVARKPKACADCPFLVKMESKYVMLSNQIRYTHEVYCQLYKDRKESCGEYAFTQFSNDEKFGMGYAYADNVICNLQVDNSQSEQGV